MNWTDSIFHRIIQGDAPSYKVYEDDDFFVILDIFPMALGHSLILPKKPAVDIFDLCPVVAGKLYPMAARIARAVKAATACDGVKIIQNNGAAAGQVVFYFHLHIVPYFDGMPEHSQHNRITGKPTDGDFALMADKIRSLL